MANLSERKHKMVGVKIQTLTPDMCKDLLGKNPNNRKVDQRIVSQYARDMLAGDWQLNGEAICIDWNDNLINGQHRCWAGIKSLRPFETVIVTGLPPASKDTIDGGKKRTYGDRLQMRNYKNYSSIAANITFMAQIAGNNLKRHALSPKEMDKVLEAHPHIEDSVAMARSSMSKVSGWLGAIHCIATHLKMQDVADDFCNALKDGQKSYEHDAAVFFREWFYKDQMKQNPSHIDFRRKLFVHAFNKFVAKEPLRKASLPDVFWIPGWTDKELGL